MRKLIRGGSQVTEEGYNKKQVIIRLDRRNYDETPFTIGTFNIRYGLADDGINIWDNRKEMVIRSITDKQPDIIGFQEALPFVRDYLEKNLPEYLLVGTGRDEDLNGEDNCIAIRAGLL